LAPRGQVMRNAWLLHDGRVLAAAQIAEGRLERARGVSGWDASQGALLLNGVRTVHTAMAAGPLDVAFLSNDMVVVGTARLARWRLARPRRRGRSVLAVRAGAFDRWGLGVGDQLEIREAR